MKSSAQQNEALPGDGNSSLTGKLLKATITEGTYICPVCSGWGHDYFECGTKKKLDGWAKSNGDSANWGNWKWQTYYDKIAPE